MPPGQGYGPINQGYNPADPFAAFDNRINYNEMVRNQMITQYAQNVVQPSTMTLSQHRAIVSQQRFQYGVQQQRDLFKRRAAMDRAAFTGALARGVMDFGMFEAGSLGAAAMGIGGFSAAGIALPLAAAAAPMHFIGKGINQEMQRQSNIHNIAADVGQYAHRLGFSERFNYQSGTSVGNMMERSMSAPGQFFSRGQQMAIHKLGLSNDLMSAKGGMSSGTIGQYTRNFEELRDTTEEVVKLLKTTIEGGMSVIKELQQTGFGSMQQIRNQIVQAKSFGGLTGLGTQNMMQIGAAGAQAVQGTPWTAAAGANMYQNMATRASLMAGSNAAMGASVQRVGGAANAGGVISNAMMNLMSSGMGTKFAAYVTNPDLSTNSNKLDRALSGRMSAYELVTGANEAGYRMGENRARFALAKQELMNRMAEDPEQMAAGTRSIFNMWSQQRPGTSFNNRAFVFAGQMTGNLRDQTLMYNFLRSNPGVGRMNAAQGATAAAANMATFTETYQGPFRRSLGKVYDATAGALVRAGRNVYGATGGIMEGIGTGFSKLGESFSNFTEDIGMGLGMYSKYGRQGGNLGDVEAGMRGFFGADAPLSRREMSALASGIDVSNLPMTKTDEVQQRVAGQEIGLSVSTMGVSNVNRAMQDIAVAKGNRTIGELRKNRNALEFLNITREDAKGMTAGQIEASVNRKMAGMGEYRNQVNEKNNFYEKFMKIQNEASKNKMRKTLGQLVTFTKKLEGPEGAQKMDTMLKQSGLTDSQQTAVRRRYQFLQSKGVSGILQGFGPEQINLSALEDNFQSAVKQEFDPKVRPVVHDQGIAGWGFNTANAVASTDPLNRASKLLGKDISETLSLVRKARGGTTGTVDFEAMERLKTGLGGDEAIFNQLVMSDDFDERYSSLIKRDAALTTGRALTKVANIVAKGYGITPKTDPRLARELGLLGKSHGGKRLFNFAAFKRRRKGEKLSGFERLASRMQISTEALSELAPDEMGLINTMMMNPETFGMSGRDRQIKEFETTQRALRNFDRSDVGPIKIYDAKSGSDKTLKELEITSKEQLKDRLETMQYSAMLKDPYVQSQGTGLQTTTRSPVLNYWNNSWAL